MNKQPGNSFSALVIMALLPLGGEREGKAPMPPFKVLVAASRAKDQKFVEQGRGWVGIHEAGLTGREFLAPRTKYWQWFEDFMGGSLILRIPPMENGIVSFSSSGSGHPEDSYKSVEMKKLVLLIALMMDACFALTAQKKKKDRFTAFQCTCTCQRGRIFLFSGYYRFFL